MMLEHQQIEELTVIPICQKDHLMYMTSINSSILYKHGDIRRQIDDSDNGIQRILKEPRVDQIAGYINNNTTTPLFVTPIVVSLNSDYIVKPINKNEDIISDDSGNKVIIEFDDETQDLFNIIDGQHRLAGIKRYDEEHETNISLQMPVVFIVDADLYSSAEIFLNINANQKPVDWSSLYNLFGILEKESGEKTVPAFSSKIASILNNSSESPFHKSIKMYGIKTSPEQFISQATVAHRIAKHTWRTKSGKARAFTVLYDDNSYRLLAKAIMNIFNVFIKTYPDTWNSTETLAKKSVGYMAIIDFMAILMSNYGLKKLTKESFEVIFNSISDKLNESFSRPKDTEESEIIKLKMINADKEMSKIFLNSGSSESVAKSISDKLIRLHGNKNY